MNINEAFPSKYLKASDLDGKNVTVTIKSAELEEIGFDKEQKLVLSFVGTDKSMVLNKTNATTAECMAKKLTIGPASVLLCAQGKWNTKAR